MKLNLEKIMEVSMVFSSFKRMVLIFVLEEEPGGYTKIINIFKFLGINIGSSELYKHINVLMKNGMISKNGTSYLITTKGLKTIELIKKIPDKSRKMKMGYVNADEMMNTFVKGQGGGK